MQCTYISIHPTDGTARIFTAIPLFYPSRAQLSEFTGKQAFGERECTEPHQEFPSGLPFKYYPGPMLLNFSVHMGIGTGHY